MIYASLPDEGLLHQGVAELEATRSGVIRTREGMVTAGVHGCQATRALEIRKERLHMNMIPLESAEVVHAEDVL